MQCKAGVGIPLPISPNSEMQQRRSPCTVQPEVHVTHIHHVGPSVPGSPGTAAQEVSENALSYAFQLSCLLEGCQGLVQHQHAPVFCSLHLQQKGKQAVVPDNSQKQSAKKACQYQT